MAPSIHGGGTRGASASVTNLMETSAGEAAATAVSHEGAGERLMPSQQQTAPATPVSATFPSMADALRTSTPVSTPRTIERSQQQEQQQRREAEETPMEPGDQR